MLQEPGKPDKGLSAARPRHAQPHRSGVAQPAEDAAARSAALHAGDERPPRRLPLVGLHRVPRHLRQRPRARHTARPVRDVRQPGCQRSRRTRRSRKTERGHPIQHTFTRAIPNSQCIVCHVHPGTTVTNTYLGTLWWDNETEGQRFYPKDQKVPDREGAARDPAEEPGGGGGARPLVGLRVPAEVVRDELRRSNDVQLADFHGHGWLFRKVFHRDREGQPARRARPKDRLARSIRSKFKKAVHLKDIHLERGMHCVDCHFEQDVHGDGHLYGSVRDAVEITCEDCHGTVERHTLAHDERPCGAGRRPRPDAPCARRSARRRFVRRGGQVYQRSSIYAGQGVGDPADRRRQERNREVVVREDAPARQRDVGRRARRPGARAATAITCFACHTSWMASCFGCHLPMRANQKVASKHFEGDMTRNLHAVQLPDAARGHVHARHRRRRDRNRVAPARSACAVIVGSQNSNREWVYSQQQTISAEGFSGIAFSTHVPHTVRNTETKNCTDCHLSRRWRQQRDHGAAAHAGHRLHELHVPLGLRRHGRAASRRSS